MTSLAEKEGLKGKAQTTYFDPPYGIKLGSNWQVSTRKRDVKDGKAEDATRQPEQVRALRDTWKLGVHSYLAYMRDRLTVARDLLTESGSIFVQIGDENVHLVRCVLDEVFGSENFCGVIILVKASAQSSELVAGVADFLIWYGRTHDLVKCRELFLDKNPFENPDERYVCIETPSGEVVDLSVTQKAGKQPLPNGRICRTWPTFSQTAGKSSTFAYDYNGIVYTAPLQYGWQTTTTGLDRLKWAGRLHPIGKSLRWKVYHDEFPYQIINNIWTDLRPGGFGEQRVYVVQTDSEVIARCLLMTTDPGDLVLDPTCGAGTTAYVAEQWGRRWITVDTSRVALALARTRLMAAKYPYYLLADLPEGVRREAEVTGKIPPEYKTDNDIRKGFVYKRAPHVTLKSIANNPDIKDGMTRRVAVSIGPEHGTVGPQQVKEAAKEAVQGVGFDVLVVCGFAFDPHVPEEAKRYGKLTVLVARMNPDLSMGDELLKKTGAGNLFMVFGEPDIKMSASDEDSKHRLTVEVRGVDVYDPTTGQIRSSSTDDIASWFIDTDYNGESLFVRHAYFTGGPGDDGPYDKLKRALRAGIDEGAWSTLYSTVSRPFAPPVTGKIAVKVINHYGDEVLKVFQI
jgi:DNA modification methylase